MKNEIKFEKIVMRFQFTVYLLFCCLLFIIFYIAPLIVDYKMNGYNSLLAQEYLMQSFAKTPSDAFNRLSANWLNFVNPFSNLFVRFFIFTAIFGGMLKLTKLSYNRLISKKYDF